MNYSSKQLSRYMLATLMLFGILVVATSTTQAQWGYDRDRDYRRDDRYGRYDNYQSLQIARQQGYMHGLNTGAADAQRGQSFSPQRSRYFRNGNQGYRSEYGNRGQYQQVFRDAFVQGYREGYQRYAGYDRRSNNGRWGNGRWPR